jgi:hypothetical protein
MRTASAAIAALTAAALVLVFVRRQRWWCAQVVGREHEHEHADDSCACAAHEKAHAADHSHQHTEPPPPPPAAPTGPPPLGAIMQLAKETSKPRKACKAALIAHAHDYDAAKRSLLPPPVELDAPPAEECAPVEGVFYPSSKFAGGRPGYIFQRGPMGPGYYRDQPMQMNVCVAQKGG